MSSKYDHLFKTEHLRRDIKKSSVKGSMHVMWSHVAGMAVETASVMVMARLLVPEDFGLIGMVLALTGFAKLFKDLGLSMATVQQPVITHEQVSLMFWVNVAAGLLLTAGVAACAPLIARFYHEPRLTAITLVLSLSFLFSASSIQHQALLRRQMKFKQAAWVYVGSIFLSVVVTLICGLAGMGVWALVIRNLSQPVFYMIGTWWLSPWIPGPPKRGVGAMKMLKFGANITGFNVVNYFSRNLDNILIGKYWGTEQLGFYAQAYKVLLFPINQIRQPFISVGIPALSMLQNSPEEYRRYYRNTVSMIALLSMPLVGFLFCCADPVIYIFLGAKWLPAAEIFRWLALVAFIQPAVTAGRGLVMLSMGYGKRYFNFGLVASAGTVLSFIIGVRWGAVGVAKAYAASNLILTLATIPWCLKDSPVRQGDFMSSTWHATVSSLVAVLAGWGLRLAFLNAAFPVHSIRNAFVQCMLCGMAGLLAGSLTFILLPGGKAELVRFYTFGKQIFFKKKKPAPAPKE